MYVGGTKFEISEDLINKYPNSTSQNSPIRPIFKLPIVGRN